MVSALGLLTAGQGLEAMKEAAERLPRHKSLDREDLEQGLQILTLLHNAVDDLVQSTNEEDVDHFREEIEGLLSWEGMSALLEEIENPEARQTALQAAVLSGNIDIVHQLLNYPDVDVNAQIERQGRPPLTVLRMAAEYQNWSVLLRLLMDERIEPIAGDLEPVHFDEFGWLLALGLRGSRELAQRLNEIGVEDSDRLVTHLSEMNVVDVVGRLWPFFSGKGGSEENTMKLVLLWLEREGETIEERIDLIGNIFGRLIGPDGVFDFLGAWLLERMGTDEALNALNGWLARNNKNMDFNGRVTAICEWLLLDRQENPEAGIVALARWLVRVQSLDAARGTLAALFNERGCDGEAMASDVINRLFPEKE